MLCVHAQSLSLVPLFVTPMDCSTRGSSVHGILQARILEWVANPFFRGLPESGSNRGLLSLVLAGGFLTTSATWGAL